ncbi:alpha/beta hydrolase domain-containing protein [Nocardiopsis sp. Huas11]|uniref:alpha/beta hydrolase domain-containing protein n=1 Tax=Nocardiopsis sp. Huas11 TaxID=2183912 RepID=UPI001F3FF4A6|nr:alpha/beta hydrolase domain-containing protein [Nocardiopsis sp. Huas11]
MAPRSHRLGAVTALGLGLLLCTSTVSAAPVPADLLPVPVPDVEGPLPSASPGDPAADDIADTATFFATDADLDAYGYVEEEFVLSGTARRYAGADVASEHPYRTRVVVRRPARERDSNETALVEWQNVTAGNDLDALWMSSADHLMRSGYTWVGVSAQNVGVSHLAGWSPARYGDLDVTDGGTVGGDALSYDVFAQAGRALREPDGGTLAPGLEYDEVLAIGASQSASRMTVYYDQVLPLTEPVFDGYGFMVGPAPSGERPEPVFQVLSETDVAGSVPREDTDTLRVWEVAGAAHSGWAGRAARAEIEERDLGGQTEFACAEPPFSRVPLQHPLNASYDHLREWADDGTAPPAADPIERTAAGEILRDADGHALGGIRLSQVEVPTALNTGTNRAADADSTFCYLFGSHRPYDEEELAERYPRRGSYVSSVVRTDVQNVRSGYLTRADARENRHEAVRSGVGR